MRILSLFLLVCLTACQEKAPAPVYLAPPPKAAMQPVEGQVFVALKNGSTLRLSAVPVSVYESTILMGFIQEHRTKWEKERSERQAKRDEAWSNEIKLSNERGEIETSLGRLLDRRQVLLAQLSPLQKQATFYRDKVPVSLKERMDPILEELAGIKLEVDKLSARKRKLDIGLSAYQHQIGTQDLLLKEDFDQYIFRQTWPTPALVTTTDADGEFKLELPNRTNFMIRASASRSAYKVEEDYEWLTPVPLVGPAHLNNHNCKVSAKKD